MWGRSQVQNRLGNRRGGRGGLGVASRLAKQRNQQRFVGGTGGTETPASTLNEYLTELADALLQHDWDYAAEAARLLSVRDEHAEFRFLWLHDADQSAIRRVIPVPFDSLTALHLRVLFHLSDGNYDDAYKTQTQLVQVLIKECLSHKKMPETNWFLPLCYRFCADARLIGKAADHYRSENEDEDATEETSEHSSSLYEHSATVIMDCFRACVGDSRCAMENQKRLGLLNLTNQLFRVYFRINKLNLLTPPIRAIENCGKLWDYFWMADKVTYKYYIGRKAMFDSRLNDAETALMYAFRNCGDQSYRNRRLILIYLVPVKMFLGHMPSVQLLKDHNLMEFADIADAVKTGNLPALDQALEKHESFFIRCGIFLMLEKLKVITYLTLFKKVCRIIGSHQISLDAFLVTLKLMKIDDVDLDEVACIVANLIYQGRIKGYISHQHQKLVISKQNPFPPLSSIATEVI